MSIAKSSTALVQYKATGADPYVTIAKITDINFSVDREALETTSVGATDRTYRYGIRSTAGSGTMLYDPEDAVASSIITGILSNTTTLSGVKMVLDKRTTQGVLEGSALITSLSLGVSVGEVVAVPVTFVISGSPTGDF